MDRPLATAPWPSRGRRFLVLAGLTGFAISQPLLSVLGDNPTTLAVHGIEGAALLAFAALVAVVPPVFLWALSTAVEVASRPAGRALYLLAVVGLVACFVVQVLKSTGIDQAIVLATTSLAVGVAFAVAHIRLLPVATWASYTAVLPLFAVGFFTMASPASALLTSAEVPEVVAAGGDHPSVVLLVLDELPTQSLLDGEGSIDRVRFPNLAAFAEGSTWYSHHSSLAPVTESAVPSLLTGLLPTTDAPLYANHPDNLFTLLAPTHELEVLESVTTLCPYDSCPPTVTNADGTEEEVEVRTARIGDLLGVTVDLWQERVSLGSVEPPALDDFAEDVQSEDARDLPELSTSEGVPFQGGAGEEGLQAKSTRAETLISSFDAGKGPALYYLHLMLPHQPFGRWPDGQPYEMGDFVGFDLAQEDRPLQYTWSDWTAASSEQRHLLQAQYTDRLIGELMDGLRAAGLYDSSLVIVTADHGISFETGTSSRNVSEATIDAISYTPLIVKAPGQEAGSVDDANLMSFDLVPTIADILDLRIGWDVDGDPAGSSEIAARGDAKLMYDISGIGSYSIDEILEWHDGDELPSAANRWIGPLADADDPLAGLDALLDAKDLIGAPLAHLDIRPGGGELALITLASLERPPDDATHHGVAAGRVEGAPDEAEVLIAINGVVVAGSKVSTDSDGRDGRVELLIPQDVLKSENEVRAVLVVDGDLRELEVVEG